MAQIRVDIESQDDARQNIQNLRQEIARIGEEIARNNRIAARAGSEDRDRLRRRNQELQLTRNVLNANRQAQSAALSGIQQERRLRARLARERERATSQETAAHRRALNDAITFRRTQRREAERAARAEAAAAERAAREERELRRRALNDAITFRRTQRREAERAARAEAAAAERLQQTRQDVFRNIAIGAGATTLALGALGRSAVQAAIEMEGIRDGLTALLGSAEAAEERIRSLRDVIREPGVGYRAAIQAAIELKAVNVEGELANRTIREVGNSLALVGRTDLNLTLLGLRQILSRGRVSQEELNQITERSSLVSQVLRDQFGTVLSEDIQAQIDAAGLSIIDGFLIPVVEGLERLDRAPVDSALNSLQNLSNSVFELRAGLGDALLPTVTSVVQGLTRAVDAFNALDEGTRNAIVTIGAITTGVAGLTTVVAGTAAALARFNAFLITTTGASGLAGLSALLSPAGPLLIGLGILAAGAGAFALLSSDADILRTRVQRLNEDLEGTQERLEGIRAVQETVSQLNRVQVGAELGATQDRISTVGGDIARHLGLFSETQSQLEINEIQAQGLTGRAGQARRRRIQSIREETRSTAELLTLARERLAVLEEERQTDTSSGHIGASRRRNRIAEIDTLQAYIEELEQAIRLRTSLQLQFNLARGGSQSNRELPIEQTRNYALELVNLQDKLRSLQDAFAEVETLEGLEPAAERLRDAQREITETQIAEIDAQIAANRRIVASEESTAAERVRAQENIGRLQARRRRAVLDGEYEITEITRRGSDARQRIIADSLNTTAQTAQEAALYFTQPWIDAARSLGVVDTAIQRIEGRLARQRFQGIVDNLISQGESPEEAVRRAQNLITTLDGISNSLVAVESGRRAVGATVRGRLVQGLVSSIHLWRRVGNNVLETRGALLDLGVALDDVGRRLLALREGDAVARLETGQSQRDQEYADRFAAGAERFRENERRLNEQSEAFVRRIRPDLFPDFPSLFDRLGSTAEQAGISAAQQFSSNFIENLFIGNVQSDRAFEALERQTQRRIENVEIRADREIEEAGNSAKRIEAIEAEKEERITDIRREADQRRADIQQAAEDSRIDSFRSIAAQFTVSLSNELIAWAAHQLRLRLTTSATNTALIAGNTALVGSNTSLIASNTALTASYYALAQAKQAAQNGGGGGGIPGLGNINSFFQQLFGGTPRAGTAAGTGTGTSSSLSSLGNFALSIAPVVGSLFLGNAGTEGALFDEIKKLFQFFHNPLSDVRARDLGSELERQITDNNRVSADDFITNVREGFQLSNQSNRNRNLFLSVNSVLEQEASMRQAQHRTAQLISRESAADLQGSVAGSRQLASQQQSSGAAGTSDRPIVIEANITVPVEIDGDRIASVVTTRQIRQQDSGLPAPLSSRNIKKLRDRRRSDGNL